MPGNGRLSVDVNAVVPPGPVSAVVETTTGGVVVERTMFWGDQWYGGHTGKALQASRTRWYLAEGDAAFFDTYILLANPNPVAAKVTVDYLLEGDAPIRRHLRRRRQRAGHDLHERRAGPRRPQRSRPASSSDQPINVERAMYFTSQGKFWAGGHEAAAVERPARDWFVAEGRTGPLFDTYLLLANPDRPRPSWRPCGS